MPRANRPIARLFIAAYPPHDAAWAMLAALSSLRDTGNEDNPPWRPTPIDMVHMTVLFLGPVPKGEIDAANESVARATSGLPALHLTPRQLITLPPERPPRVLAIETDNPAPLPELRSRLVRRLANQPRRRPSDRFVPHFTLARFTSQSKFRPLNLQVDLPPFRIDQIHLVRSVLRPDGAVHTTIASHPLAAED